MVHGPPVDNHICSRFCSSGHVSFSEWRHKTDSFNQKGSRSKLWSKLYLRICVPLNTTKCWRLYCLLPIMTLMQPTQGYWTEYYTVWSHCVTNKCNVDHFLHFYMIDWVYVPVYWIMHDQHFALIPRPFFSLCRTQKVILNHRYDFIVSNLLGAVPVCSESEKMCKQSILEFISTVSPSAFSWATPWLHQQTPRCWPSSSWCSWLWIHTEEERYTRITKTH